MIEIPDYEIKQALGSGGMATVYLAIHTRLQREIALKVMAREVSVTEAFQKGFLTEARTVAKLEHPNIVKIYDIDTQNGHFYMSMELLSKGSLKERIANGKLPVYAALNITEQIANALKYAHQKGYIHRDIKPANIMFREDGSAVLTDFGIAKMQGTTGEMTQMGFIAGTPYYMAPEQATGSNQIDQRADIYSLGVMFYEMLTGTKPFTGSNTVAITYEHVHGDIPTLQGDNEVFQLVIDKALAKNPDDRFDAIEDFSKALHAASHSQDDTIIMKTASQSEANTLIRKPDRTLGNVIVEEKPLWPWLLLFVVIGGIGVMGAFFINENHEKNRLDEKQLKLDLIAEQQKADKERREAYDKQKQATLNALNREKEMEEIQKISQLEVEKKLIQSDKINNLFSLATIRNEKRRVFDHSGWSEGCKQYLEDIDGPYDPKDTSEFHLQKILSLDAANASALQAIEKIRKRRALEFSDCDTYVRSQEEDPLKDLFQD